MSYNPSKNIEFSIVYNKTLIILFLLTSLLFSDNFDKSKLLKVGIQYGYGNYFSAFVHRNIADESNYNEFIIDVEKNINKQFGIVFLFNTIQNKEKGYGTCEGTYPYHYNTISNAYLASASFYLNWEYIGFKFGILGYKRERGFCEEGATLQAVYPAINLKLGLINRFYFIVSGPKDLISSSLFLGLKYHFKDYFSQIWMGKLIKEKENDFYSLKIQILLSKKFIVSSQGFINFSDNLKSLRIGIGYVFKLAD